MAASRSKIALTGAISAVIATTGLARAYPGERFALRATLSIARARTLATQAVSRTVVPEELEIVPGVREVGIDAKHKRPLPESGQDSEVSGN